MHNCKWTRDVLLDFALGETSPEQTDKLLAELNDCASCHTEYATLKNTLRVSQEALHSVLPAEEFWPGYHSRLQQKLAQHLQDNNRDASFEQSLPLAFSSRIWNGLRSMATISVRVPLPVGLALLLLAGFAFVYFRSPAQIQVAAAPASVETRIVQVPLIQEKVVTQVVYVERKGRRQKDVLGSPYRPDPNAAVASAASGAFAKTAMSLSDFKPTDKVKLTIIKGSYQDEK
ncbi:MAG TPA: hypothetical protein VHR36_00550 [Pyrinomonadaceae bacterium]|nr:hypothetical protein [Pyrinomonadaceae bacterium]